MKQRAKTESQAWCCVVLPCKKTSSFYPWPKHFLTAGPSMVLLAAKKQAEVH